METYHVPGTVECFVEISNILDNAIFVSRDPAVEKGRWKSKETLETLCADHICCRART
jgi:hypothetical protein